MEVHCNINELTIDCNNIEATILHIGSLSNEDKTSSFALYGKAIATVSKSRYLGCIYTCKLSFSVQLKSKTVQANMKLGQLFNKIEKLNNISAKVALELHNCYIHSQNMVIDIY